MRNKQGWLIALAIGVLLVAACGPQPATPTPKGQSTSPTEVAGAPTAAPTQVTAPPATTVPLDLSKLPVDPSDWHALGSADAKVTVTEYSEYG